MPPKMSVIVLGFPGLIDSVTRFLFSFAKKSALDRTFSMTSAVDIRILVLIFTPQISN